MNESVGSLNIEVTVQLAKMQAQFDDMQKKIGTLNNKVRSQFAQMSKGVGDLVKNMIPAVSVAALASFGKSLIEMGSHINDLSIEAGVGSDAFQALALHFMDSGVSMEDLTKAFVKLRKATQEAVEGNKQLKDAFSTLGIDPVKLQSKALEQQLEIVAIAIVNATDQNKAFNAALDILGAKTAPKLLQSLRELGVEGFDKIAEKTKGVTLTPEQLKTLDDAGDKLARIWMYTKLIAAKAVFGGPGSIVKMLQELDETKIKPWVASWDNPGSGGGDVQSAIRRAGVENRNRAAQAAAQAAKLQSVSPVEYKSQGDLGLLPTAMAYTIENAPLVKLRMDEMANSYQTLEGKAKASALTMKMDFEAQARSSALTQEQINRQLELADSYKQLADPTIVYKNQLIEINQLLQQHRLTSSEAAAATEKVKLAMEKTNQVAMEMGWAFSSAFEDAIISGGKLSDVLRGLAQDVLRIAIRAAITAPIGNWLGGIFGGALGIKTAPGHAAGGPVDAGMPYMVGERGPELFVPSAGGTIIPHGATNSATSAKGGGTYYIDARGADRAGLAQLSATIARINGTIEARAVQAVYNARRRGAMASYP